MGCWLGCVCGDRQSGAHYSMKIGGCWLGCVCGDRQLGAHRMEIGGVGWVVYVVTDSRELTVWR